MVSQLEAANITGLRIISPAVLRPLLRAQQPKGPNEVHPFITLTATQALQLLEYCCSDLAVHDDRPRRSSDSSSREGAPPATASAGATEHAAAGASQGGGGGAASVAAVQARLPANLPQGAANAVADVFGPAGLAVLGGLATQMQQRLVTGVDDVLNIVMDAMGSPLPQEQQQQGAQQAGPAPPPPASSAAAVGHQQGGAQHTAAAGAAAGHVEAGQAGPVNLNKVSYLKGLPVPTAGGTIAMLGVAHLYVFPPECSPPPTELLPAHLLRQFVLPECIAALAWLLRYPEVRSQLRLTYYGLEQLSGHLKEALGPTWTFAETTAPIGRLPAQRPVAACMPGTAGFPAVVAWDDGAAGGPYYDWLVKLWRVILQIIASVPAWHTSITAGPGSSSSSSAGSSAVAAAAAGTAAAGVAEGFRSAAQRARGLAEAIAGEVAQALNVPAPGAGSAASSAGTSAAAAAAGHEAEAEQLWQPLLDWPLLPLADGRLLKLRYRELALAVVPEYQQARPPAPSDGTEAEVRAECGPSGLCCPGRPTVVYVTLLGGSVLRPWIGLYQDVSCEPCLTSAMSGNIEIRLSVQT